MKRNLVILCVFLMIILSSCGSKNEEEIEQYKSEAHYFYTQVDGIIQNINVIEGMDSTSGIIEDNFFSSTLDKAFFKSICLENLISVNQYYNGLDISNEQMKDLYSTIPQNEEIDKIRDIIDKLNTECMNLKKMLEDATEYNSNFIDEYNSVVGNIRVQANILYDYVDDVESAIHDNVANNEIINKYTEELENNEKNLMKDSLGSQSYPLCVGDSVEVSFIDNGAGRKADSWYVATGKFTYKGYSDGVVNLNFELVNQEAENGIVLGSKYGSGFTFMIVNENLQKDYVSYEGGVYRSEDKNEYIAILEGGNVDFSVKTENDTSYLVIYYVDPTEENLNVANLGYATEKTLWFKLD